MTCTMTVRVIRIICDHEAVEFYRDSLTGFMLAMCPKCLKKEQPLTNPRLVQIGRDEYVVRSVMES